MFWERDPSICREPCGYDRDWLIPCASNLHRYDGRMNAEQDLALNSRSGIDLPPCHVGPLRAVRAQKTTPCLVLSFAAWNELCIDPFSGVVHARIMVAMPSLH